MSDTIKLEPLDATGAGAGDWLDERKRCREPYQTFVIKVTGSPSAVTVDIEGDIDGYGAVQLGSHAMTAAELSAGKALFHIVGKIVDRLRYNIITFTGGTDINVSQSSGS